MNESCQRLMYTLGTFTHLLVTSDGRSTTLTTAYSATAMMLKDAGPDYVRLGQHMLAT